MRFWQEELLNAVNRSIGCAGIVPVQALLISLVERNKQKANNKSESEPTIRRQPKEKQK